METSKIRRFYLNDSSPVKINGLPFTSTIRPS